ncbi:hypothetical protein ABZ913_34285, partial [Streptosporangium sandarakinum]
MDVPRLLRRAADLVPAGVQGYAGLSRNDILDYLDHDEWEVALGVLEDFDGLHWQTPEFWECLAAAAQQLWLGHDAAWCHWRARETERGRIRAELRLRAPDAGGRPPRPTRRPAAAGRPPPASAAPPAS